MKRDPEHIVVYSFLFVLVIGILGSYAAGAQGDLSETDKTRLDTTLGLMLGYIIGRLPKPNQTP